MKRISIALSVLFVLFICAGRTVQAQRPGVPQWTRGIVWYQILIDRFANGNPENDPVGREVLGDSLYQWEVSKWTANWFHLTVKETLYNKQFYPNAYLRQYGGDFQGIVNRLDYLKRLGADALMLSPVFSATSSHKYDVNSLHHASENFGTRSGADTAAMNREVPEDPNTWYMTPSDREFAGLVRSIHDTGMKVVMDAQFVHVSPGFWAFRDLLKKQETSKYGTWFVVKEWDKAETPFESEFSYESMWGVEAFPKFRSDSLGLAPGPREYVFAATRKWMDPNGDGDPSDGVDGWRIVLAPELPGRFWEDWCGLVKSINPNAVVIAEWSTGAGPAPECFDIVYSKRFARGVSGALITRALYPTQLDELIYRNLNGARDQDAAINIVGDLETDRLASQCVNNNVLFEVGNTPQRNPEYKVRRPNADERRLQRQVLMLQFAMVGSPMVYYGDEAGMWGADDPGNRKPMLWPDMKYAPENSFNIDGDDAKYPVAFDSSMYEFYRRLIGFREDHLALKYGAMQTLVIDDVNRLYAFRRESGSDKLWVVMNGDDTPHTCTIPMREYENGTRMHDPFRALDFFVAKGRISIVVPPRTVSIIAPYW